MQLNAKLDPLLWFCSLCFSITSVCSLICQSGGFCKCLAFIVEVCQSSWADEKSGGGRWANVKKGLVVDADWPMRGCGPACFQLSTGKNLSSGVHPGLLIQQTNNLSFWPVAWITPLLGVRAVNERKRCLFYGQEGNMKEGAALEVYW